MLLNDGLKVVCAAITDFYVVFVFVYVVFVENLAVVSPRQAKMDQVRFDYSTKNIPIPPRNSYLKSLIEKVESAIKRMRWKAFFFDRNDQDNKEATNNNNFGFKSRKCPPQNSELDKFEADLLDMVHNIKFRNVNNKFQNKLNEDISLHSRGQNFKLLQT